MTGARVWIGQPVHSTVQCRTARRFMTLAVSRAVLREAHSSIALLEFLPGQLSAGCCLLGGDWGSYEAHLLVPAAPAESRRRMHLVHIFSPVAAAAGGGGGSEVRGGGGRLAHPSPSAASVPHRDLADGVGQMPMQMTATSLAGELQPRYFS